MLDRPNNSPIGDAVGAVGLVRITKILRDCGFDISFSAFRDQESVEFVCVGDQKSVGYDAQYNQEEKRVGIELGTNSVSNDISGRKQHKHRKNAGGFEQ